MDRMTLDAFVALFKCDVDAFAAATRKEQEAGSDGFVGEQFTNRTYDDWLAEMAAYGQYVDLEETVRRTEGAA